MIIDKTLPFPLYREIALNAEFAQTLQTLREGKSASIDGTSIPVSAAIVGTILSESQKSEKKSGSVRTGALKSRLSKSADEKSENPGPILVICPDETQADAFCMDLTTFSDLSGQSVSPLRLAICDPFNPETAESSDAFGYRLKALKALDSYEPGSPAPLIVGTLQSILLKTPARETLANQTIHLAVNDAIDMKDLIDKLLHQSENGFIRVPIVVQPGEFSVRGGIIDVFPLDADNPVRIEFWGDTIESIRTFEVSSQRSLEKLSFIDLTVSSAGSIDPQKTTQMDKFTDHLPPKSIIIYIEPVECENNARKFLTSQNSLLSHWRKMEKMFANQNPDPLAPPAPQVEIADLYWQTAQIANDLFRFPMIQMGAFASMPLDFVWHFNMETVEQFNGEMNRILKQFDSAAAGQEVHLLCATKTEVQRLTDLFAETQTAKEGRLLFHVGLISSGFRLLFSSRSDGVRQTILSADNLFLRATIKRTVSNRRLSKAIDSFSELSIGDYVVHLAHGIARCAGIEILEHQGMVEENLKLEFADDVNLFVPVSRIGLIQKYVGGIKGAPPLAKIGGKRWEKQKERVAAELEDMAGEMLEIQAKRKTNPGIAFPVNTELQKEFDECFPYQETPDQLTTMDAINQDMGSIEPMDRLLCGDVGFGKTEMAVRAAFRAVEAGYQVAIMVPTTVLCEQHYQTFRARMAEFPVRIASLSRFVPKQEQEKIIKDMLLGKVDIVIGTHRLISEDVHFSNLGLIIIDEEQKFGVEVKEKLKRFRASVDVLTMTATPIPRTLHSALLGIRDISNLQTPPADRVPVETHVNRYSPELVKTGIERELARNGQVFFVHNKVYDIDMVADRIKEIVPEARVVIGHAQMAEGELERVMRDFVLHKFDVLVCTTIVESGLDIPNANTMFIDQADCYGLANLHQLRGRVGRYKNRAYCYLLVDPHKVISQVALKRLKSIEEFNQLGSGFTLAMRDLEIRGAGNILGKEQSGHIAAIGYELYCQLLEAAVRKQNKLPPKTQIDVSVVLPMSAYIPDFYISELRQKMDFYRRLSRVSTLEDVDALEAELRDRFNAPPNETVNLIEIARLRIMAHQLAINKIYTDGTDIIFEFASRRKFNRVVEQSGRPIRVTDDNFGYMKLEDRDKNAAYLLAMLKKALKSN
ncbi:MAG: transcription-repair coupling factor [Thermoguttaceae bacterium]|nr:transcription-repair coupling factor [Thermoguttaceae bacterium]